MPRRNYNAEGLSVSFSFLHYQATFENKMEQKGKKKNQIKTNKAALYVTFMLDLTMKEIIMMRCIKLAIIPKILLRLAGDLM